MSLPVLNDGHTDGQMDGQTDGQTGPILNPRPLTWEGMSTVRKGRRQQGMSASILAKRPSTFPVSIYSAVDLVPDVQQYRWDHSFPNTI